MTSPFLAEIRIFPFNFAPVGWAFCDGQILPLSQNTALFALLGTTYGGDGKSNFALPNLQGSSPMFYGQGPGLSLHDIGEAAGEDSVTLLDSEMPAHTHAFQGDTRPATLDLPGPSNCLARSSPNIYKQAAGANLVTLSLSTLSPTGASQPHNNLMPYLTLNFCIALQGVFPPRS